MKNMKKLSILLAGCLTSLCMMAQGGYVPSRVDHNITQDIDPFNCNVTVPLASTLAGGDPYYVVFYEYVDNNLGMGPELLELGKAYGTEAKTMEVAVMAGEHTYVVAAKRYQEQNAPKRHAPQANATIPDSDLPGLVDFWGNDNLLIIEQCDVYNVKVKYHLVEHTITIPADMFTNKAEFELYTTAGTVDPVTGNTFCGVDIYSKINEGTSEDITGYITIGHDTEKVKETVSLSVGTHTYSVYMINRYLNIEWCDRFTINVTASSCTSGLVYSKWDDFLFVDNGDGGGKGKFVSYQWYKDGHKLDGATYQWYRSTLPQFENAMPSGQYYVRIKDVDGNEIITCPKVFSDFPRSEASNHHNSSNAPARKQIVNGQLRIEYNGIWYNAQGMEIK